MKKIIALALTLCICVGLMVPAFAAEKKINDNKWIERRAFLEENIIALGGQDLDKVDQWLAANGVVKTQDIQDKDNIFITDVEPLSSSGSAYLDSITGYYDSYSGRYLIKGWWRWKSINYPDLNAGALDGVSLAMCKTTDWSPTTGYVFSSNPTGIAVYDQDGNYYSNAGSASKIDRSGILYTFQDMWAGQKYVGYKGQVWTWLDQRPSQLPFYLKMDYEHTYSSANLQSYGFTWPTGSAPSINMVFNSVPSNWKIANQSTIYSWPVQ